MSVINEIAGKRGTTYSLRWRSHGKQVALNVKTKRLAQRADAWLLLHPNATRPELAGYLFGPTAAEVTPTSARSVPTLAVVWESLRGSRKVSANRAAADDTLWASQCAEWHNRRADQIKPSEIDTWTAHLDRLGYAPATVSNAFGVLRMILNHAERDELITRNPIRFARVPSRPAAAALTDRDVLDVDQVWAVLDAAPELYRALYAVMITTGARLGEALALRPADLDLETVPATVTFSRRVVEVGGRQSIESGLKTGKHDPRADVPLPLPTMAVEFLRAHLEAFPTEPDAYLFASRPGPRTKGGALPSRSSLRQRVWHKTIAEAGVPASVTMQKLRHTAITLGLTAGMSLPSVQARVGHARGSRITMAKYARVLPQTVLDDHERIDSLLGKRP